MSVSNSTMAESRSGQPSDAKPTVPQARLAVQHTFLTIVCEEDQLARSKSDSHLDIEAERFHSFNIQSSNPDAQEKNASVSNASIQSKGAPRTRRPGPTERKRFQQSEVYFTMLDGGQLDADLLTSVQQHLEGKKYLKFVSNLPPSSSLVLQVKVRQPNHLAIGFMYIADFKDDGRFVVDAFVLEDFRSQLHIADMIRWGFISMFSQFSSALRSKFIQKPDVTVMCPLANIADTRQTLVQTLQKLEFQRMSPAETKVFLDQLGVAPALDCTGRVWMKKGPLTWFKWMEEASKLFPSAKRPANDLSHDESSASARQAHGSPVRSKKLRSAFSQGESLCAEGLYGSLVVSSHPRPNGIVGIIPPPGLDLEITLHCNQHAVQEFVFLSDRNTCHVKASVTLISRKLTYDTKMPVHYECPTSSNVLHLESSDPPVFSGNVRVAAQDFLKRRSDRPSEFDIQVVCRLYESAPNKDCNTGCELLSHIFEANLLAYF